MEVLSITGQCLFPVSDPNQDIRGLELGMCASGQAPAGVEAFLFSCMRIARHNMDRARRSLDMVRSIHRKMM